MSRIGLTMDDGPRTRGHRRRKRRRRRRRRMVSLLAVVVSVAVVGGVIATVLFGGRALFGGMFDGLFGPAADYAGPGSGEVSVTIEPGASLREIGSTLAEADVVASTEAFVEAAEENPDGSAIQAGDYVLLRKMKAADAVVAMIEATTVIGRVAIPEGYRLTQIVDRVAEETGFPADDVLAAIDGAQGLPEYAEGEAEGFLFPATYDIQPDTTAASLVQAMLTRFGQAAETVGLEAGAGERDLTPREVVTIASIVEREVAREEDMPMVAEVVYNRLSGACSANGIPAGRLQLDSTVHYAVGDNAASVFTTDAQRAVDSPYNTYLNSGLPPGPIASPGEAALGAALDPSAEGYCYFTAVDLETGETRFAVTAADHNANVAALQAFCRRSDLC
ncbi:MAG TPA: endolytic transglycosylase MltG [Jiangellaceae bacterium]|nr:endolytic transglycosylase MltG [Jiangellaceae bacterium]